LVLDRYREKAGPGVIKPLVEMLQKETSLKIVAAEALCNIANNNGNEHQNTSTYCLKSNSVVDKTNVNLVQSIIAI
jgi:hypothetical protein